MQQHCACSRAQTWLQCIMTDSRLLAGVTAPSSGTSCQFGLWFLKTYPRSTRKTLQSHSRAHNHRGYNFVASAKWFTQLRFSASADVSTSEWSCLLLVCKTKGFTIPCFKLSRYPPPSFFFSFSWSDTKYRAVFLLPPWFTLRFRLWL